jgi:hypothetical protein
VGAEAGGEGKKGGEFFDGVEDFSCMKGGFGIDPGGRAWWVWGRAFGDGFDGAVEEGGELAVEINDVPVRVVREEGWPFGEACSTYVCMRMLALKRISSTLPSSRRSLFFDGGSSEHHAVIVVSALMHVSLALSRSSTRRLTSTRMMPWVKPMKWAKEENSMSENSRIL